MNREPSLIDLGERGGGRETAARCPPRARFRRGPRPPEVTFPPNMAARAQEVRSLPTRDAGPRRPRAGPHAPPPATR
ncbi:unnamed protein product, partial [Iphiclides podalirius]